MNLHRNDVHMHSPTARTAPLWHSRRDPFPAGARTSAPSRRTMRSAAATPRRHSGHRPPPPPAIPIHTCAAHPAAAAAAAAAAAQCTNESRRMWAEIRSGGRRPPPLKTQKCSSRAKQVKRCCRGPDRRPPVSKACSRPPQGRTCAQAAVAALGQHGVGRRVQAHQARARSGGPHLVQGRRLHGRRHIDGQLGYALSNALAQTGVRGQLNGRWGSSPRLVMQTGDLLHRHGEALWCVVPSVRHLQPKRKKCSGQEFYGPGKHHTIVG